MYNITDYGAKGDQSSLDTEAIQQAINVCHASGGGKVYCPAGIYLIGTIVLKSNVNLFLESGAKLFGSSRREDYIEFDGFSYLIYARDAENITVSGEGEIDGNGDCFFIPNSIRNYFAIRHSAAAWRPRSLLHFLFCRNLTVQGVILSNPPFYTLWPFACDIVRISGIKILTNPQGVNTDGIDIDCCSDTIISDCYIKSGDDAIAVKSDCRRHGIKKDCENIVVNNCVLVSTCSGIRLGYEGDGAIRNCLFTNIIIHDTQVGIDMLVPRDFDGVDFFVKDGPMIEHVHFSNMRIECQRPFHLWIGDEQEIIGGIRDVSFSNISAKGSRGSSIFGAKNNYVGNIRFKDVQIELNGEMDSALADVPYPSICWGFWDNLGVPYGLFCRYARDLEFENVKVSWNKISGDWLNAMKFDTVKNVRIVNFSNSGNNLVSAEKPIEIVNSESVTGI